MSPPGQHRFQADVETVHNLMEQEFYEVERFSDRDEFIAKADHYQLFFNLARSNSAKEDKTPWELITQKHPAASPFLPLLSVQYLDQLHDAILHSPAAGGTMSGDFPMGVAWLRVHVSPFAPLQNL